MAERSKTHLFSDKLAYPSRFSKNEGTSMGGIEIGQLPYGAVTKGEGAYRPRGTYLYRRREEAYHYTHVGGGCVGTTYMGSPRVGSCAL